MHFSFGFYFLKGVNHPIFTGYKVQASKQVMPLKTHQKVS